jgi:hypothetical protein
MFKVSQIHLLMSVMALMLERLALLVAQAQTSRLQRQQRKIRSQSLVAS